MPKVLVVEDNRLMRMVNERFLKKAGYEVVSASDGEEALKLARTTRFDIVLLDMLLPKMEGLEVLRSLRQLSHTAQIPIVILTSLSQKNEERLRNDGAVGFFEKSRVQDNPQALLDAMEDLLRQSLVAVTDPIFDAKHISDK